MKERNLSSHTAGKRFLTALLVCLFVALSASSAMAAKKPKLSKTKLSLRTGGSATLKVSNVSKAKKISWSVSNKNVISIKKVNKKKYTVTAKKPGTATFTVKVGKKKAKCKVTVSANVPIYTGSPEVDYLLKQICKDAKLKDSMSDEKLMYTLYKWMTKKCVYWYEAKKKYGTDKLKLYYDFGYNWDEDGGDDEDEDSYGPKGSVKSAIDAYKKECDAKAAKGLIKYNDGVHIKYQGYDNDYVMYYYTRLSGTCSYFASLFTMICERYGMKAGLVDGTIKDSKGEFVQHVISWVEMDGKKVFVDIGSSIHSYTRKKKFRKDYFKLSKKARENNYKFTTWW